MPKTTVSNTPEAVQQAEPPVRAGLLHFSVSQFFGTLVLLLISSPFLESIRGGVLIQVLLVTVVFFSAVLAVGARRRSLVIASMLFVPTIVIKWAEHCSSDMLPQILGPVFAMVFTAYIIVHLLGFILRSPCVNSEVLFAAVSAYLVMGIFWSFAYTLTAKLNPDAFAFNSEKSATQTMVGSNALYFSFVTMSTAGYGDIVPVSNVARMLAMSEATIGLFYMTILVARLVAAYTSTRSAHLPRNN